MQLPSQMYNRCYCNTYRLAFNLLLLIIYCFLQGCTSQKEAKQFLPIQNQVQVAENAVNINTATEKELEALPHIGKKTARNIIEFRQKYGRFHKPEHLLLVRRVSDGHFREIRNLIKIE